MQQFKATHARKSMSIYFIWQSVFIGLLSGGLITLTRLFVHLIEDKLFHFAILAKENPLYFFLLLFFLCVISLLVHLCLEKEPFIGGHNLPTINKDKDDYEGKWKSVLPYKFLGSAFTLASGVTMGIEGPSVQLGAFVGQAVGEKFHRPWKEKKIFITAGISAALAAAFHAPLTGVIYSMEIIKERFSKIHLMPTMLAAMIADYLVSQVFHILPVVHFPNVTYLPLNSYWLLLPLSCMAGIAASFFHLGLPVSKRLMKSLPLPIYVKRALPFLISGILYVYFPILFGAGESILSLPLGNNLGLSHLLLLFLVKFALLFLCCGAGLPGGVFFPILVLGSLVGNLGGTLGVIYGFMGAECLLFCTLLAMAGVFAGAVRAPLTAIVLVLEMTGSFQFLLPLVIVSIISPLISRYLVLLFSPMNA